MSGPGHELALGDSRHCVMVSTRLVSAPEAYSDGKSWLLHFGSFMLFLAQTVTCGCPAYSINRPGAKTRILKHPFCSKGSLKIS